MTERKVFGLDSAVMTAEKLGYGRNMSVSAQLIIDVAAEIEQRGRTADYWKANGVAANAEIERLNGLLVKIANIVNLAHFTTEELGSAD